MSHFVRCDRCAKEEHVLGTVTLPPGWQKLMHADLCEPCCRIVRDFIQFKPSDAAALPIEPAPTEPPPAPAADGTKLFETDKEEPCVTRADSAAVHGTDSLIAGVTGAQTLHAGMTMTTTSQTTTTSTKTPTDSPALECNAEERAREKKRKRMRGQNAILPDQRPPQPGAQP